MINILNDRILDDYLYKKHFEKFNDRLFVRIHDIICIDTIEIIVYGDDFFSVKLAEYVLINQREEVLNCIEYKDLKALESPMYDTYWWSAKTPVTKIVEMLERYGEKYWDKYNSVDKIMDLIQYYIDHAVRQAVVLSDCLTLFNLYLIKNNYKNAESLADKLIVRNTLSLNDDPEMYWKNMTKEMLEEMLEGVKQSDEDPEMYWKNMMGEMLTWVKQSDDDEDFFEKAYEWGNQYYVQ